MQSADVHEEPSNTAREACDTFSRGDCEVRCMVAGSGKLVKPCERLSPFDLFVAERLSRTDAGGKGSKACEGRLQWRRERE